MRNVFRKVGTFFRVVNFKTLYFNFKYLPFNKARHLPILISSHVRLHTVKGSVELNCQVHFGIIKIGFGDLGIFDPKRSRTIWQVSGKVIFNGGANVGHGSKISVGRDGVLVLGDEFRITAESSIICHKSISFGSNCLLSWNIYVLDTDFHFLKDVNTGIIVNENKAVLIGDNVWIGANCCILKGSAIPSNTVIAAFSLVNKNLFGHYKVFGGNPIQILREDVSWSH
ncbi:acyltransferase [Chryseosolibacter indicus]|uniref:Acyltransferase n=1 Tax=Chryseosolibacter indicus TaxID=2782351 RepID=A0ABS5VTZ2_9BACT|nr:acyltransferase [Chryseosolibacter indicus]MBT1704892.1 acyltransferase [Chryseosolibacter indicus]